MSKRISYTYYIASRQAAQRPPKGAADTRRFYSFCKHYFSHVPAKQRSFIQKTSPRRASKCGSGACAFCFFPKLSLQVKRLAVRALVHGRITFMSADQNGVERAVILIVAMMAAIVYRALDTLISLFHFLITSCFRTTLLLSDDMPLIFAGQKNFHWQIF